MKKSIGILLCLIIVPFIISGCESKEVISQRPIELRFTPAHTDIKMVPQVIGEHIITVPTTLYYSDKYEVKYFVTYIDYSTDYKWIEVDKTTYERARDKLPP